ncbi:PAS domain S-box protein [Vibrio sinaloensis]|uniref:PAS domain-containing protein n=1 Tax=Photobacterium sp. (strain ATCC 43367) TaxID=379097 RepID=UPI002F412E71
MNESHATAPQQQGKKSKYVVYDWAMNLKTQAFYCDNEGQTLMFGEVYSTFSATRLIRLVPPGQRDRVKRAFQTALTTGEDCYLHCCLVTPTSLFTFVEIYMYKADEHHLKGTISPCLVISNAQEASEIFYGIFENQHHGVVVTDSDTRILACNHYFEKMTGYLRNELVGLKTNIFNSSSHDDEHYRALWESLGSKGYWSGVLLSRHAQGKVFPQSLTIQKIGLGSGQDYYIGLSTDLSSDLDRLEDTQSGGVDILTQLPTSDHFLA